jgi:ATP-dependent Clp protease protease subunit
MPEGIIRITGEIDDVVADSVISQIHFLIGEGKDIYILINTEGGSWPAGLAIVDTIRMYKDRIHTICTSKACSVGAVILSSAARGNRYVFPHANVVITEPNISVKVSGNEDMIQGYIDGLRYAKNIVLELLSENTQKSEKAIEEALARESFMTSVDAIELGLCDKVVDDLSFIKQQF